MQRHFVSYAPRFGSYKEPRPFLVKQSPYYWWWLALTLNEDYAKLCEQQQRQRASTSRDQSAPQSRMLKVYEDWGDVRYDGDRYRAFCDWWRNRVNTNEERGAYLFAEPLRGTWTRVLADEEDMHEAWEDDAQILIALPVHQTRHHAHKSLNRIVRKHIADQKGRSVSDPRLSKARYHLNTAVQPRALKLAFDVWDLRNDCAVDVIPQRIPKTLPRNVRIARAVGLKYKARQGEVASRADEHRNLSTHVSRYLRQANEMIANASMGTFP